MVLPPRRAIRDETALGRIIGLTAHPAFDGKNPNRLRALVSTFASFNPARFHDPSGAGYRFLADQILARCDGFNPMTGRPSVVEPLAAGGATGAELGALMKAELERILAAPGLSKNVFELVSRSLAEATGRRPLAGQFAARSGDALTPCRRRRHAQLEVF